VAVHAVEQRPRPQAAESPGGVRGRDRREQVHLVAQQVAGDAARGDPHEGAVRLVPHHADGELDAEDDRLDPYLDLVGRDVELGGEVLDRLRRPPPSTPSPTRTSPRSDLAGTSGSDTLTTTGQPMVSAAAPAAVPPRAGSPTSSTPYGVSSSAAATAGSRSGAPPRPACRVATQARAAAVRAGSAGGASSAETRRHAAYLIARASASTATRGVRKTVSPGTGVGGVGVRGDDHHGQAGVERGRRGRAAQRHRVAQRGRHQRDHRRVDLAGLQHEPDGGLHGRRRDLGPRSTGLAAPTRGSSSRSRSCRSDDSTGTERPSPSAIPAVITPIPPALLSTPIRNPPGSGCWVSTAAVSAMSAPPGTG
jgi:hypothetical protein